MGRDDRRPFGKGNLADKTDSLDAGVVDKDVDPVGPRIDRLERVSDAGRIGDIGFEIDNAGARLVGASLSRENTLAPSASSLSAIASPIPRAAPVTTATRPASELDMGILPLCSRPLNTSASRR